ncbi:hypothetical protein IFM89_006654 [Coptis chinensis]|uniref:Uncharacterized protein n=1 Tax=Coptis chinensis TaxID=261450 RepID=A0A835IXA1_9MAGN|nr:hypothetical protein IFM89_006654 [Coptis chinensis]
MGHGVSKPVVPKKSASPPVDNAKQIPTGIQGSQANNYFRADGQNTGNFIMDCKAFDESGNKYTKESCNHRGKPTNELEIHIRSSKKSVNNVDEYENQARKSS